MEGPCVEEHRIAGRKLNAHGRIDERPVCFDLRPQKQLCVQTPAIEFKAMTTGQHAQRTVLCAFFAERKPDTDKLGPIEGPVPDVLMPERCARMAGKLRHHAIVMPLCDAGSAPEQGLDVRAHLVIERPRAERFASSNG